MELHIIHSSVKGGRKALDNGMVTAVPRIYVENHHANLVIVVKVSYALLQQDIDTTFLFYPRKYGIVTNIISLYHRQLFYIVHTNFYVIEFYHLQR